MSPQDMAAASRCSKTCPNCSRSRVRRARIFGWLLIVLAGVAQVLVFPVDGLIGAALTLAALSLLWKGVLTVARAGRAR